MSKAELSTRRGERENQIAEHVFVRAFPEAQMSVPQGKNFFVVKVDEYIYKITISEVGRK